MSAFVGRDFIVNFAIAKEDASTASLVWQRLGMMRGKKMGGNWDTVDTTADLSPSFTKTNLVTFKDVSFEGDGVTYSDTLFNQDAFRQHVLSPGSTTDNQPKVWLQLIFPSTGKKYEGPFIVTKWEDDAPYADAAKWSISAKSNGDVAYA